MPIPLILLALVGLASAGTAAALHAASSGGGGNSDGSGGDGTDNLSGENTAKGKWTKDKDDRENGTASYKNERYVGKDGANRDHQFSKSTYDPETGKMTHEEGAMMTKDGKHTT